MSALHHDRCLACGGALIPMFESPAGPVGRCGGADCHLLQVTDQPSDAALTASYERLYYGAAGHDQFRPVKENSDAFKLRQHFEALDAEVGLRGRRILDYGCGIGNFIAVALENGADAAGIETNEQARSEARRKGFRVEGSIDAFAGEQFDVIYLNDVIEHLRDPVATCAALRHLLSPGGTIFIATINVAGLKARLLRSKWDMIQDPTHLYFFSARSLALLLRKAGFDVPREVNFQVAFSHHGWFRRQLQRVLVATGLGSSLKMVATAGVSPSAQPR